MGIRLLMASSPAGRGRDSVTARRTADVRADVLADVQTRAPPVALNAALLEIAGYC